jgi:hypothetical protein
MASRAGLIFQTVLLERRLGESLELFVDLKDHGDFELRQDRITTWCDSEDDIRKWKLAEGGKLTLARRKRDARATGKCRGVGSRQQAWNGQSSTGDSWVTEGEESSLFGDYQDLLSASISRERPKCGKQRHEAIHQRFNRGIYPTEKLQF